MMSDFKGVYSYTKDVVGNWQSNVCGVYYIGVKTPANQLRAYYIGRAVSEGGIKDRLQQHLSEGKWQDATHFGYHSFSPVNAQEIEAFEKSEIIKYSPKYNVQHN